MEALPRKTLGTVGVGIGGEVRHWVGRLTTVELGPLVLEQVPVALAPEGATGDSGGFPRKTRLEALYRNPGGEIVWRSRDTSKRDGFYWDEEQIKGAQFKFNYETPLELFPGSTYELWFTPLRGSVSEGKYVYQQWWTRPRF